MSSSKYQQFNDKEHLPCGCSYPEAQIVQDHPRERVREFFCVVHGAYKKALRGTPIFIKRQRILTDVERFEKEREKKERNMKNHVVAHQPLEKKP